MTKINVYQTGNFCSKQGSKTKEEETKGDNPNENKTNTEDDFNEDESQANYKTSRKIRFIVGKCFKYFFIFGGLVTLYNAYLYKRKSKPEEHLLYNRYSYAIVSKISYFWRLIYGSLTLPFNDVVLPEKLQPIDRPIEKTLVVNLNKTLVNYEYKFGRGFEILKRPGLLKFLAEMGQVYEIVIFGTEESNFVEEVCSKLDQFGVNIKYKLGKEATRLVNGKYVKDLSYLNRDLRHVVVIDYNPDNVLFHPSNTIVIPEFKGDGKDRELVQMIVFLKELSKPEVKDVRRELEKYGSYKPYLKFYKSNPKFNKLLPKETTVKDDRDLVEAIKSSATANK